MRKLIFVLIALIFTLNSIAQTDSVKQSQIPVDVNDGLNLNQSKDSLNHNQDSTKNLIQQLNDNSYENKGGRGNDVKIWSNDKLNPKSLTGTMQDCVMMKHGKMMMIKSGIVTSMDPDMLMTNGTRVMSDGGIYVRDGIQTKMREGQYMDMSGNMMTMQNAGTRKAVITTQNKPLIRN